MVNFKVDKVAERSSSYVKYLQGWTAHNLFGALPSACSQVFFLVSDQNFPCFNFCPLPLVLSMRMSEKSLASPCLQPPWGSWRQQWHLPRSSLLTTEDTVLSRSPLRAVPQPLVISATLRQPQPSLLDILVLRKMPDVWYGYSAANAQNPRTYILLFDSSL